MRNFVWVLFSVFLVLASANLPAHSEDSDANMRSRSVDEKLFEWCLSQFPKGTHFSHSKVTPEESRQVEILVSQSGEAMLMVSGYSQKLRLEGPGGVVEERPFGEAWPACFISSKHL